MSSPYQVGPEAVAALAVVHAEAFAPAWSRSALEQMVVAPGMLSLAVGRPESLDGFILVRAMAGEAEVLTLAVRPPARRCGIGRRLVEAACDLAADAGAETLWLEVAVDNAAARALYGSAGFVSAGTRRGYYARPDGPATDALVLRRSLRPEPGGA